MASGKINVLYFIPCLDTGGTERLIVYLSGMLDPERFHVEVCAFRGGPFEKDLAQQGKAVHFVRDDRASITGIGFVDKGLRMLRRIDMLASLIRDNDIHVVHTHHNGPLINIFLLRLLRRHRFRWVHTEHIRQDIDISHTPGIVRVSNRMARHADRVTGVSEAVADYYRDVAKVPAAKVVSILNGVEVGRFEPKDGDRKRKRRELGFSEEDVLVGTVGNLRPQKNHANLIRAFRRIAEAAPAARLVLAGDGECREELERLAGECGIRDKVHFLGFRLDAHEVMAALDVYCLPSFFEGMPLSILEAWAAGLPVVATEVLGIREVVEHEVNGLLVPTDDPDELADALLGVMGDDDLREAIRSAGSRLVRERFTIQRMVTNYENLYADLAASA